MAKRKIKIVLDTNWYISATINRQSRRTIYPVLTHSNISIYYSRELFEEYERVIKRPTFSKYVSIHHVNRFMKLVLPKLKPIEVTSAIQLSRDKKDDFILSLAKDAKAHYIITADNDLLVLKKLGKTKIVTMKEFLAAQGFNKE